MKIRFWGVSVTTPQDGLEVVRRGWGYTIQVLYNVLNQQPQEQLLPLAQERGFGVIARVPLASGLFHRAISQSGAISPAWFIPISTTNTDTNATCSIKEEKVHNSSR